MDQDINKDQNTHFDLFGLTNLFKGLNELLHLAENIEKKNPINIDKAKLEPLENGVKGVYGLTFNTVSGIIAKAQVRGSVKKGISGPKFDKERQPLTEILDQKDKIIVIFEIPGVNEKDIIIELKGEVLTIVAINNNRKYRKRIPLLNYAHKQRFTYIYENGILEIEIKK